MGEYTREEREEARQIISSIIGRCEKIQPKFAQGTPQHALLANRLYALRTVQGLMTGENRADSCTQSELTEALQPISSIISKCKKAQQKFSEGSVHFARFEKMIRAMVLARALITDERAKRG